MRTFWLAVLLSVPVTGIAQWEILDAHTTADLRGIDNVGKGVVWASGSNGTVLRSEDDGFLWQGCAIPPGAEKLDFRGVQAFDKDTAIVMSSGPGDLSRLYKTTDGCQTWKLLFTNPDKDGFWDAIQFPKGDHLGILIGDSVNGYFPSWRIDTYDSTFQIESTGRHHAKAEKGEAAFAASNSALFVENTFFLFWIATGGPNGARVIRRVNHDFDSLGFDTYPSAKVPIGEHTESSGIFGMSFRSNADSPHTHETSFLVGVAVGGDYKVPDSATRTAAFTANGGKTWQPSITLPHGYRSAVAYDAATKTWITVGPNGTDVSTDDGRNWHALKPDPKFNEAADKIPEDQHWNALSLPFVVGPHGRIGKLRPSALQSTKIQR